MKLKAALFSRINKENPRFLNKTFSYEVLEEMRKRMSGSLNPMYGKTCFGCQ